MLRSDTGRTRSSSATIAGASPLRKKGKGVRGKEEGERES